MRSHPKDRHPRPTVGFEPPMQGSSNLCARRSNHCATSTQVGIVFEDYRGEDVMRGLQIASLRI
jgi:hypothetical protein